MTQVAFDPFSTEEVPSKGYINHLLWEHDLFVISPETDEAISYFLDQVCEETVNGIDLVSAWIIAVRDICCGKRAQLQFPTTKAGFPLFPIMIDIMQLEPSIRQSALAFYQVADPNYNSTSF